MELHPLRVFLTVAAEKSFSRAAEKLRRTQPAVSLSIQRLEAELGDKLIDRSGKELALTDAGRIVLEYARRFENMQADLENALAGLRDKSAGRLIIGASESSTLYLLDPIDRYRLAFPKIKVEIRRCPSSRIPAELLEGDLELGVLTYDPADDRLISAVIYTDHLAFIVSPAHRFASRAEVSIAELGSETFIAHNIDSPYRDAVVREFARHKVPLNRGFEMPTLDAIRKMVQRNEGVAFLPRMAVEEELRQGNLREVRVKEISLERNIRLVYPAHRALSHAAQAFLDVVQPSAEKR